MKKFISFTLYVLFLSVAVSFAQTKINTGNSAVSVQVKRCFEDAGDVKIDILLTVNQALESRARFVIGSGSDSIKLYDDEGGIYKGGQLDTNSGVFYEYDGKAINGCYLDIARGIPRRFRIVVKDVNEYATAFPLISILYNIAGYYFTMTIKDLPITKD